jgi:hypothetical protein
LEVGVADAQPSLNAVQHLQIELRLVLFQAFKPRPLAATSAGV